MQSVTETLARFGTATVTRVRELTPDEIQRGKDMAEATARNVERQRQGWLAQRHTPTFGTAEAGINEDRANQWNEIRLRAWAPTREGMEKLKADYKASLSPECNVSFFSTQPDHTFGGFVAGGTRNKDPRK